MTKPVATAVADAYLNEWSRSVARLVHRTRDVEIAEDCVQDAFESALKAWLRTGIPDDPGAWIRTAAWRRFIDGARSARTRRAAASRLTHLAETHEDSDPAPSEADLDRDELALLFYCAHPSLDRTSQVMLILRIVGGLSPREIAAAFFLQKEAVRSRLLRAKRKLRVAKAPLRLPEPDQLSERLAQVLTGIYLIYNEAYLSAATDAAHRPEIATVALRLADRMTHLLPDEGEVHGLLALLLFSEARLPSRSPKPGLLVPLGQQDRSRWSRELIALANNRLTVAGRLGPPGIYMIQAAISGLHCDAKSTDDTDWGTILGLYGRLSGMQKDPVISLNRLVAIAHVNGPSAAMEELTALAAHHSITDHYLLHAVRGEILHLLGETRLSAAAFAEATEHTHNSVIQRALLQRSQESGAP